MKLVKDTNTVYAIHIQPRELANNKTAWFTEDKYGIQVAEFNYNQGKQFKPHKHKKRERSYNRTQEVMIVVTGKLLANVYDNDNKLVDSFTLEPGDVGVFLQGGHGYQVLEDSTVFYEIKNGPFTNAEEDKEYFKE